MRAGGCRSCRAAAGGRPRTPTTAPRRGAARCPRRGSPTGAWRPGAPARGTPRRAPARRCTARAGRHRGARGRRTTRRLDRDSPRSASRAARSWLRRPRGRRSPAVRARHRPEQRRRSSCSRPTVGDPGGEALGRAEPRDRLHLPGLDPGFPLDVDQDPRSERQPVAEARVHRVLEVRVRVDEAGKDRPSPGTRCRVPSSSRVPTAAIRPSSIATAPSRIGGPEIGSTQSAERTCITDVPLGDCRLLRRIRCLCIPGRASACARRRDRALAGAQQRTATRYGEGGGPWGNHGFPHAQTTVSCSRWSTCGFASAAGAAGGSCAGAGGSCAASSAADSASCFST